MTSTAMGWMAFYYKGITTLQFEEDTYYENCEKTAGWQDRSENSHQRLQRNSRVCQGGQSRNDEEYNRFDHERLR